MSVNEAAIVVLRILLPISLTVSTSATGQNAENVQHEEQLRRLISEAIEGYRFGDFLVRPEASLTGVYDSNVFATRNDEIDDYILVLSPNLSGASDWKQHELKFDLGGAFGRYQDENDEDYDDYWGNLEGRYDFSRSTNLFGGIGYAFEHEDRGSPEDDLAGKEPTTFSSATAHFGIAHSWSDFSVRAGGTFERLDFDDEPPVINDDRDRDLTGLGFRLVYRLHSQYDVYLQGISDVRDYDTSMDDATFQRDSDGYRADLGLLARFSNSLKGEIYAGWLDQSYDDPRFSDVSEPDFGGSLRWRAAPRTTWSAAIDRSLEETTLFGASSYLYTSITGYVRHLVTPRVTLSASASIGEADYQEINRDDDYYSAQLGMRYSLSSHWYLGAEYRVLARDSSVRETGNNAANRQDLDDYGRNQFFLTLGSLLYPVKPSAYWDKPSGEFLSGPGTAAWPGFYAGVQLGHNSLNMETEGVRGGSGIDQGEFSDADLSGGLFAGYGFEYDRWYLGLEIEAERTNADIFHKKDKDNSRTIALEKNDSYGAALRAGYRLPTGPLLYARLGGVNTEFESFYSINNLPDNAHDRDSDRTGVRYGLGTDISASDRMFVRLDYSYTAYEGFDADIVTETEEIDPSEALFRLGLGWRFGGQSAMEKVPPVKVAGGYAGVHVGHGALQSDLGGIHNDSDGMGGAITSDFVGEFGFDSGFTGGVFLGYGMMRQNWYLGVEGELEDSTLNWDHVRFPRGRNFSVDKKDSRGLSVRGGYALPNGALLYARAGRVRTGFNTTWAKGANRNNDIDRDDTVNGTRYGVGAELPITRSGFVRMDYTFTDYDGYSFVTAHGNTDDMEFENSETLFRLGLGIRF